MKTKKSILARIKITKTGKLLHRPTQQRHFKAKYSSRIRRRKRKLIEISKADQKMIKKWLG